MSRITMLSVAAGAAVLALGLAGCSASTPAPEEPQDAPTLTGPAALVPEQYREAGALIAGVRPAAPYVTVASGENYSGLAIDLYQKIGEVLELDIEYLEITADAAVPSLQAERIDMTAPMGDFVERQELVDFVDFAKSEVSALSLTDRALKIGKSSDLCGLTVAVEIGVAAEQAIEQISQECVDAGKEPIASNQYPDKNAGVLAVQSARVDALIAPFAANAEVANAQPAMFVSEPISDALSYPGGGAVYGIAVTKGTGIAEAIEAALQALAADGSYDALFAEYGIAAASLAHDDLVINGVTE